MFMINLMFYKILVLGLRKWSVSFMARGTLLVKLTFVSFNLFIEMEGEKSKKHKKYTSKFEQLAIV